jgi:hypothetical protein
MKYRPSVRTHTADMCDYVMCCVNLFWLYALQSSTMAAEAEGFSETSICTDQTTRQVNPDGNTELKQTTYATGDSYSIFNPNNSSPRRDNARLIVWCVWRSPGLWHFFLRTFYRAGYSLTIIITWCTRFEISPHMETYNILREWNPETFSAASRYHDVLKFDFVC